jgi:hypothetical protein
MSVTDPREALAEQSSFVGYLLGLAGLSRTVRALAADGARLPGSPCEPDDFVHLLLGLVSIGDAVERLAGPDETAVPDEIEAPDGVEAPEADFPATRWLR